MPHRPATAVVAALVLALTGACGDGGASDGTSRAPTPRPTTTSSSSTAPQTGTVTSTAARPTTTTAAPTTTMPPPVVVAAVGDIGTCGSDADEQVAALVDPDVAAVVLLGDIAYDAGTPQQYADCFAPAWEPLRARLRPSPGNHDYGTPGASGYFAWFGAAAGEPGRGWYSFDVGTWHVAVLNSNCWAVGGCQPGSEQELWLRADLAAAAGRCTLLAWHHPRWSSGPHGGLVDVDALWRAAVELGADVVVAGHDHVYERFAPLDADGQPGDGPISFVVGTGGAARYALRADRATGSEVADADHHGLLRLELGDGVVSWTFVAVAGTPVDAGYAGCR
jgi:acid phosphatase type 7